jgi:hypothetical protein
VQSHELSHRALDRANARHIEMLVRLAGDHLAQQTVHVSDRRRDHIDAGFLGKLTSLFGVSQVQRFLGTFLQNRGRGADLADLALDQNFRADRFGNLHRSLRLFQVLFEREFRCVEDNFVVAGFGYFLDLLQRMSVVGIEKDRKLRFIAETADYCCGGAGADEFPLAPPTPRPAPEVSVLVRRRLSPAARSGRRY